MNRMIFIFLIFIVPGVFAGCSSQPDEAVLEKADRPGFSTECMDSIEQKCTSCHYLTRVCQAMGTKSRSKWGRTVKTMVKRGAKLTDNEQAVMVQCLAEPGPELNQYCQSYR